MFALLATLIPSVILGLLSFHQNDSSIRENLTRELRTLANHASSELISWINRNIQDATPLTTSRIMIEVLSNPANLQNDEKSQAHNMLNNYLRLVQARLDKFLELTVIDTQQEIIASSSDQSFLNKSLLNDLISLDSSQQSFILPPVTNEQFDTVTVSIALPILSYENYILGQLVVTYDLQSIRPKMEDPIKSSRGEILMVNTHGQLLLTSHGPSDPTAQLSPDAYQSLVDNPGELHYFQDFSQKQVIGLAQKINVLPVIIIAGRNYEEVYAARIEQRDSFVILV
ncbi:MAG TPA: cache domain-containing protein, partial [Nitrosomonas sp.]|nr:cache domain-containing protein [Nitrosomonas sp.]